MEGIANVVHTSERHRSHGTHTTIDGEKWSEVIKYHDMDAMTVAGAVAAGVATVAHNSETRRNHDL